MQPKRWLALAMSIVLAHGGTIDVNSNPGAGSTISIRLHEATCPKRNALVDRKLEPLVYFHTTFGCRNRRWISQSLLVSHICILTPVYNILYISVMKSVNALKLRQQLGSVLRALEASGQPILIERNSKPAAVLISLEDYQMRFVDREADLKRKEMVETILRTRLKLPAGKSVLDLVAEGRR